MFLLWRSEVCQQRLTHCEAWRDMLISGAEHWMPKIISGAGSWRAVEVAGEFAHDQNFAFLSAFEECSITHVPENGDSKGKVCIQWFWLLRGFNQIACCHPGN